MVPLERAAKVAAGAAQSMELDQFVATAAAIGVPPDEILREAATQVRPEWSKTVEFLK